MSPSLLTGFGPSLGKTDTGNLVTGKLLFPSLYSRQTVEYEQGFLHLSNHLTDLKLPMEIKIPGLCTNSTASASPATYYVSGLASKSTWKSLPSWEVDDKA